MSNYYIIYTRRFAAALREMGFSIVKVGVNPNKPEFDCYFFEDSEEFRQALTELTKKLRR